MNNFRVRAGWTANARCSLETSANCKAIYVCVAGFACDLEVWRTGDFEPDNFVRRIQEATRLLTCCIATLRDLGVFRLKIASMVKILQESALRWLPVQLLLCERTGRQHV